jgi:hypothetical protein
VSIACKRHRLITIEGLAFAAASVRTVANALDFVLVRTGST